MLAPIAAVALVTILGQARRVERTPIVLQIGGITYRIHATAPEEQVRHLAQVVDEKLREIAPTGAFTPQSFLLVALAFAHEAAQERGARQELLNGVRALLHSFLTTIDHALGRDPRDQENTADELRTLRDLSRRDVGNDCSSVKAPSRF